MPLVLDDVLVNFDADRSSRAATVMRDFAAEGHQLLVFTCHEHIARLFKSLDVRTCAVCRAMSIFPVPQSCRKQRSRATNRPRPSRPHPRSGESRTPKPVAEPVAEIAEPPPPVESHAPPAPLEEPALPAVIIEPPEPVQAKPLPQAVELEAEPVELPEPAILEAISNGDSFQHRADLAARSAKSPAASGIIGMPRNSKANSTTASPIRKSTDGA